VGSKGKGDGGGPGRIRQPRFDLAPVAATMPGAILPSEPIDGENASEDDDRGPAMPHSNWFNAAVVPKSKKKRTVGQRGASGRKENVEDNDGTAMGGTEGRNEVQFSPNEREHPPVAELASMPMEVDEQTTAAPEADRAKPVEEDVEKLIVEGADTVATFSDKNIINTNTSANTLGERVREALVCSSCRTKANAKAKVKANNKQHTGCARCRPAAKDLLVSH